MGYRCWKRKNPGGFTCPKMMPLSDLLDRQGGVNIDVWKSWCTYPICDSSRFVWAIKELGNNINEDVYLDFIKDDIHNKLKSIVENQNKIREEKMEQLDVWRKIQKPSKLIRTPMIQTIL